MPLRCFRQPVKATITRPVISLATNYQNTKGRPIIILVPFWAARGATSGVDAYVMASVASTTPPAIVYAWSGLMALANAPAYEMVVGTLVFVVPNAYYYRVEATLGTGATCELAQATVVEL